MSTLPNPLAFIRFFRTFRKVDFARAFWGTFAKSLSLPPESFVSSIQTLAFVIFNDAANSRRQNHKSAMTTNRTLILQTTPNAACFFMAESQTF